MVSQPSSPAPRGPYAKSGARRQDILESALDLFATEGFEGTSLTAIGEAVGVSREALRHYFSSREELLLAVMDAADRRSRALMAERPDSSLVDILEAGARYNVSVPGLVSLYVSLIATAAASTNVGSREFIGRRFAALRAEIAGAISAAQVAGEVRCDIPADMMASLIIGASDGLSMQWLLDPSIDIAEGLRLLVSVMRPADNS